MTQIDLNNPANVHSTDQEQLNELVQFHIRQIKSSYPFRSQLNSLFFKKDHEVNNQPSQTIPDQSMSVKTIMDRYARGLPLEGQRVPIYDGEDHELAGLNLDKLDLSEKHDLVEANKQRIADMQQDLNKPKTKPKPLEQLPLIEDDIPEPPPSGGDAPPPKKPK